MPTRGEQDQNAREVPGSFLLAVRSSRSPSCSNHHRPPFAIQKEPSPMPVSSCTFLMPAHSEHYQNSREIPTSFLFYHQVKSKPKGRQSLWKSVCRPNPYVYLVFSSRPPSTCWQESSPSMDFVNDDYIEYLRSVSAPRRDPESFLVEAKTKRRARAHLKTGITPLQGTCWVIYLSLRSGRKVKLSCDSFLIVLALIILGQGPSSGRDPVIFGNWGEDQAVRLHIIRYTGSLPYRVHDELGT